MTGRNRTLGVSAALVGGRLLPGDVSVADGQVVAVGLPPAPGGRIVAAGLVDIQVNGFAGVDVMGADPDGLHHLGRALLRHGVTAWVPTLITASGADTRQALERFAAARARWPSDAAAPLGHGPGGMGAVAALREFLHPVEVDGREYGAAQQQQDQ